MYFQDKLCIAIKEFMYMQQLTSGLDFLNTTWNAQVESYSIEKTNKQKTKQNKRWLTFEQGLHIIYAAQKISFHS